MKKMIIKRTISKSPAKSFSEAKFWRKIALEQQILIHAKNST
ncbi:MAG: hypothetical protein V1704_03450 [Candidatus Vogelbacteria bacterium]